MPTILSLCDLTGTMVAPWVAAGYRAILVDPQHPPGVTTGQLTKVGHVINHPTTWQVIRDAGPIAFCAAFPPCTDVAVAGAAHFEFKAKYDPHFQAKAALIAEQCRTIGNMLGCPWFFENPVSVFSNIFGPPSFTFDPFEYGGYLPLDDAHPTYPDIYPPRDGYPKKTCLWAGGGFELPPRRPVPKVVKVFPGYATTRTAGGGIDTKNMRSVTPRGFAIAVYKKYGEQHRPG